MREKKAELVKEIEEMFKKALKDLEF